LQAVLACPLLNSIQRFQNSKISKFKNLKILKRTAGALLHRQFFLHPTLNFQLSACAVHRAKRKVS
jgi:hypothetical protein